VAELVLLAAPAEARFVAPRGLVDPHRRLDDVGIGLPALDLRVDEAVERGNAYLAAGADCVYPIFCPVSAVAELARLIDGPINVLVIPGMPERYELGQLGVARMTWGAGLASLAYAEAVRVAAAALAG
jgi:2-methylisocitrate lyase-like PEP mutase family enzyme